MTTRLRKRIRLYGDDDGLMEFLVNECKEIGKDADYSLMIFLHVVVSSAPHEVAKVFDISVDEVKRHIKRLEEHYGGQLYVNEDGVYELTHNGFKASLLAEELHQIYQSTKGLFPREKPISHTLVYSS